MYIKFKLIILILSLAFFLGGCSYSKTYVCFPGLPCYEVVPTVVDTTKFTPTKISMFGTVNTFWEPKACYKLR